MTARHLDVSGVGVRLDQAAETGDDVEVIVVLRGRVRRAASGGRWRVRLEGGRVLTFPADLVVAVTPVAHPPRRARS